MLRLWLGLEESLFSITCSILLSPGRLIVISNEANLFSSSKSITNSSITNSSISQEQCLLSQYFVNSWYLHSWYLFEYISTICSNKLFTAFSLDFFFAISTPLSRLFSFSKASFLDDHLTESFLAISQASFKFAFRVSTSYLTTLCLALI